MSMMIELERPPGVERVLLVRMARPEDDREQIEESLDELTRLAETAGAEVVDRIIQRRAAACPATLIGSGKVGLIHALVAEREIDAVIFDSDLTPRQGSNLEKRLDCKVIDRTQLILDIFAQHAQTNEGKLQVELAQLEYVLPRLAGRGSIMRQQGGIGVRGPGEQKLEVDRRVIRRRIQRMQGEIQNIRKARQVQRRKRTEDAEGIVALVGYTNAGKSSLLNALCGSDVLVENKLFATLDPRSRRCALPSGREIILTDTVGFIRQLPHSLVAAFRATLEEAVEADLLVIVADASDAAVDDHFAAVQTVLDEIGAGEKRTLVVFNKIDAADDADVARLLRDRPNALAISAQKGEGLEALRAKLDDLVETRRHKVRLRIPQESGAALTRIYQSGKVLDRQYEGNDILLDVEIDAKLESALSQYVL